MVPWLMRQNCNILSKKGEKEKKKKNEQAGAELCQAQAKLG